MNKYTTEQSVLIVKLFYQNNKSREHTVDIME